MKSKLHRVFDIFEQVGDEADSISFDCDNATDAIHIQKAVMIHRLEEAKIFLQNLCFVDSEKNVRILRKGLVELAANSMVMIELLDAREQANYKEELMNLG